MTLVTGRRALECPVAHRSIAGEWESDWGLVTLKHDPLEGKRQVIVSGGWDSGKGSRGKLQKAVYDPQTGMIVAHYVDEVANDPGTAELRVVFGGKAIVGVWIGESGSVGGWSMWRKGEPRPDPMTRSVAGEWDSNYGRVTLAHGPIKGAELLAVTGSYEVPAGKRNEFKDSRLDRGTGILTLHTTEDGTVGFAQLMLSPDGRELTGAWANARNQRGTWTMKRRNQ